MELIKLDDTYAIESKDGKNLILLKLTPIMKIKYDKNGNTEKYQLFKDGKPQFTSKQEPIMRTRKVLDRHEYKRIGNYGKSFELLIKDMLHHKVLESTVSSMDNLIKSIDGHIASISYDKIVQDFQEAIYHLESENKSLKQKIEDTKGVTNEKI